MNRLRAYSTWASLKWEKERRSYEVEGRTKKLSTIGNRFWGVEWKWEGQTVPLALALNFKLSKYVNSKNL